MFLDSCDHSSTIGWCKDAAESCCVPHRCKTCGKEEQRLECWDCVKAREAKKEAERFEKAQKITEWEGWVFADGCGYKDGYFHDLEELFDWLADQPPDARPEYVWACREEQFVAVSLESILEDIASSESAYEDFETGSLKGQDELRAALEAFAEANKDTVSYFPDYSKAILLDGLTFFETPNVGQVETGELSKSHNKR